jgi:hypothetical protein
MSIRLTVIIDNISQVLEVYDRVEIRRADNELMTESVISLTDLGVVNSNNSYITLTAGTTYYYAVDNGESRPGYTEYSTGTSDNWYQSRYYNSTTSGVVSGWSEAVRGEGADLFYDPCYPPEISMTDAEQLVVDEIRRLIGDPIDLNREYGEDAASSIHPDGMTYELDEKGWPTCVTMGGVQYNTTANPTINGYRYLIFENCINTTEVVCSGTCDNTRGIDIWYYTWRWSPREILEAYNSCPIPPPLNSSNVTSQAYIFYTAKRLLQSENWHDAIEDGALIKDEGTTYDPSSGFNFRKVLLDDLNKQLDDLIRSLILQGISGVRIE